VNPLFFLTRLDTIDDTLAAKASELGFTVLRAPLFATEAGTDAATLVKRLSTVGDGVAIAWTSRRAAEVLANALPRARRHLAGIPLYALGEESAAPVRRAGFSPVTPGESAGAAGLARFILSSASQERIRSVLFMRGDRSLPDLPNGLKAGGIEVLSLEIYRTRFLDADVGGLATWLTNGDPVAVAFFSPSGVVALERLLEEPARALLHDRAAAIARGSTTAEALETRGYRNVFRPDGTGTFETAALEALLSTSGGPR
jgi:uroporphyrinogen-III synthase